MTGYFLIKGTDASGEPIPINEQMLIGRSEECDLKVTDGHPSRRHAMLTIDADGAWLEDLDSANGTFVNARQINERTRLENGDVLAFDASTFMLQAPVTAADADSEATVVRRATEPEDSATVVRAAPAEPAAAEPPADPARKPTPEPSPQPPLAPPTTSPADQVPKSWADPEFQAEGTRILKPEELRAMAAGQPAGSGPSGNTVPGPHLLVMTGADAGTVLKFGDDASEWSIGTDADRELNLADSGISAFHAKISHEDGRWKVIDQMSANHTFVNDQQTTVSYLRHGDRVRFASVECEIRLPGSPAPPPVQSTSTSTTHDSGAARPSRNNNWVTVAIVATVTLCVLYFVSQYLI